jgi:hypothetical protein
MTNVEKLQALWAEMTRHGVPQASIHALVEHAQDMEADRVAVLISGILEQRDRVREFDSDLVLDELVKALQSRDYRPR